MRYDLLAELRQIGVVCALWGALEREDAVMAGLIIPDSLGDRKPRNFEREVASAGDKQPA